MVEQIFGEIEVLNEKIKESGAPEVLKDRVGRMTKRLEKAAKIGGYSAEYELISKYIEWITSIPWGNRSSDNLELKRAQKILDDHHYGLEDVKERVLEYLASMSLRGASGGKEIDEDYQAPILCLVGLQGIGKTTIARSIAEALGREFVRVSLGGIGSILEIRGRSKVDARAEPGQIIKALVRSKVMNPLILLDEVDKVSGSEGLRSDVMAVLLEILDPEQNTEFKDHYVDYPVDLSSVLFICSANNTGTLSTALLDRLEVIQMPAYTDEQKIQIAKGYLLPKILKVSGLAKDQFVINEDVWSKIIRPLGFDSGIRTLQRMLESMVRKVSKEIVEGKAGSREITVDNFKEYLPKW